MRIIAIAVAGLLASTPLTASIAQATATTAPAQAHIYPLQPPSGPVVDPDPVVAVQNFQAHIFDLHDNWDALSPDERNRQLKALQQEAPLDRGGDTQSAAGSAAAGRGHALVGDVSADGSSSADAIARRRRKKWSR
ncbi:hypothetical protein [Mycobacterium genavense]|uniref:hypothetical protein n=1 Tax=Mycobacterium genavense TaxID=36812 RepID=UPI0004B9CAFF|nr:hypothetical protein [Mycobacterium genavense]